MTTDEILNKTYNSISDAIDIAIQDQTSLPLSIYFTDNDVVEPIITTPADAGVYEIEVDDTAGIAVDGSHAIEILQNGRIFQSIVLGTTATSITFASPLDFDIDKDAIVQVSNWSMNVDGSTTPVIYAVRPPAGIKWDITNIMISMVGSQTMDDGTFGPLGAITKGVIVLMKNHVTKTLGLFTNNGGFFEWGASVVYPTKPPSGAFAVQIRKQYGGQENAGVVIRLDGDNGEELQFIIQDDLSDAKLTKFAATVIGHVVED